MAAGRKSAASRKPARRRAAAQAEVLRTNAEVLQAIKEVKRVQQAQSSSTWQDDRELVLRQLTEIRRALGMAQLHRLPGGHSRNRPLGTMK